MTDKHNPFAKLMADGDELVAQLEKDLAATEALLSAVMAEKSLGFSARMIAIMDDARHLANNLASVVSNQAERKAAADDLESKLKDIAKLHQRHEHVSLLTNQAIFVLAKIMSAERGLNEQMEDLKMVTSNNLRHIGKSDHALYEILRQRSSEVLAEFDGQPESLRQRAKIFGFEGIPGGIATPILALAERLQWDDQSEKRGRRRVSEEEILEAENG
ncbi:MAG: hypothetical protein JNJ78_14650 [Anaerolineae bacterium]|jgi:hypothetical protein|nr:hypothetical protein [Anaerolineae bacterium]